MKLFIKKISIFLGLCLLIISLVFGISSKLVKSKVSFKLNPGVKYVVFGHSHPACAYNDSVIDHFQNVALSGEAYFYSYPKVKNIIDHNEDLAMIFIELTNNQISESINSWIWDDKYLSYHYAIHYPFIEVKDNTVLIKNNPKGFIANLPVALKTTIKKMLSSAVYNVPQMNGGYEKLTGELKQYKEEITKNIDEDFVEIDQNISTEQIKYLSKIIAYAKSKGVEVILIRSPQHKSYEGFQNEDTFVKIVQNEFKEEYFLDLKSFPLSDEEFRDKEHLNFVGAIKVSKWLNKVIVSNSLKKESLKKHYEYSDFN